MAESLPSYAFALYAVGALATTVTVVRAAGIPVVPPVRTGGPPGWRQWLLVPVLVLARAGVLVVVFVVLFGIWPVVGLVIVQRRHRRRAVERALDAEDTEDLLREARAVRRMNDGTVGEESV